MRSLIAAVLAAALVGACTSAAVPAPTSTPTPASTDAPTPSPSVRGTKTPTARPASVLREIDVGDAGWGMTMAGGALWIQVDPPTDAIVRVDLATGEATPAVPRGHFPRSGGAGLWVVGEDFLASVDPETGAELLRVATRGQLAVTDDAVWIITESGLHEIDPTDGHVRRTTQVLDVDCSDPSALVMAFDSAWLACKEGSVQRIDPESGAVTSIVMGAGTHTFHVSDAAVWATNYRAGTTARIDPSTNAVTTIQGVGNGIGITEGGGLIWVATTNELVGLDADGTEKRRVAVPPAQFWYDLVWTEEGIWGSTAGPSIYLIDVK